MKNSYNEAYRLLRRSGKEAGFFIAASLVSAGLYVLMCGVFNLEGAYGSFPPPKVSLLKSLLASFPGDMFMAWFAAGLVGRFTIDALTSAPEGMLHYAKGWFLRKLIADTVVMGIIWGPLLFMIRMPSHSIPIIAVWMLVAGWLSLRISLWLNASVAEDLGLIEAMKRSYAITSSEILRIAILAGAPLVLVGILAQLIGKMLPGQTVLVYYLKSLLNSAAAAFTMGLFTMFYVELRAGGTETERKITEERPA